MTKLAATELETISFGCMSWSEILNDNFERMEDTLLHLQNLLDVDITSLADQDVLVWNSTSQKFENDNFYNVFPNTTTTSSTTTTSTTTTSSSSTVSSSSSSSSSSSTTTSSSSSTTAP